MALHYILVITSDVSATKLWSIGEAWPMRNTSGTAWTCTHHTEHTVPAGLLEVCSSEGVAGVKSETLYRRKQHLLQAERARERYPRRDVIRHASLQCP